MSWTETVGTCPEAIGPHQLDGRGRCCFCGHKISRGVRPGPDASKRPQRRHAQDPLSIDGPDEGDYLDGWG